MIRRISYPWPLLGLAFSLLIIVPTVRVHVDPVPVYSVTALRAHLARDPLAWVDRPLRVRAIAHACAAWYATPRTNPCIDSQPVLSDPSSDAETLPMTLGSAPPLLSFLRGVPFLDSSVPGPQRPRWDAPAVYNIQLRSRPCAPAPQPPCYEAQLLDAGTSPLIGIRER